MLGSGNEFLVYDSNGDGLDDYSAGTVGARVLDVYNVTSSNRTAAVEDHVRAVNGTLLPPIDPDGHYFGVMTDFYGHGTSSAASVASKGIQEYDIYNDTGKYSIVGAAPGASILPVKSLWFGDTVYAWLWTAGFDNDDTRWEFTGRPRADIVSNSWGVSNFPTLGAAPGMDILSLVLGALAVPHSLDDDFPGVTMVTSAGNSGPGYGTMGMPNSAPFGISVGATTNNVFVGYGPFRDQPRFGNSTEHHGHVVDFSSRGPGMIGDPKPDLMSSGAHSFVPSNVLKLEKDSDAESFSLFGGTSMATPLVAGSAAVLMQSMRENMMEYDPFVVKNILMSTASDLQNDALTQGSGMVDAKRAVDFVHGEGGVFAVHNDASYRNIRGVLSGPMGEVNSTMLNLDRIGLSGKAHPMTGWFGGHLPPGGRSTATFTVENPTAAEVEVAVSPQRPELVRSTSYDGVTRPLERDRALNDTAAYVPNYIQLSDVRAFPSLRSYYGDYGDGPGRGGGAGGEGGGAGALEGSDLLVLTLNFPFGEFMNKTNDTYGEDLRISSLYLYDWVDGDNDTRVASDELSMVSRGGSWGTVQELRVSEPASRFEGIPLVGVYPVPTKFSFWTGDLQANSTAMNYTLSSSYYRQQEWDPVWVDRGPVTVPPGGSAEVTATIVVPEGYETGVYNGFLRFSGGNHTANVPVSFAVTRVVEGESDIMIRGEESDSVLHAPGFVKGAFDMTSRYMAGDWRQYYFDVRDPSLNTAAIELSWENEDTNLAVFAVDPAGRIVQTNVPSGVFGQFMGWPSLDWLGVSPFSEGGGFFPAKNKDGTSTVLYVPMNQTGTYGLLVHSTLFAGESATEPITLSAKFTSVLGPERPPRIKMHVPGTVGDDTVVIPRVYDYNLDKVVFFANSTRILQGEGGALDFGALADGFYILTVTAFDTEGNYSTEQFEFVRRGAPEQRDGDDGGSGGGDGGGN